MRTSAITCDRCGATEPINWRVGSPPDGWDTKWINVDRQEEVDLCPPCVQGYEQVRDEIEAHVSGRLMAYITEETNQ